MKFLAGFALVVGGFFFLSYALALIAPGVALMLYAARERDTYFGRLR